jgi:hypothetical protein
MIVANSRLEFCESDWMVLSKTDSLVSIAFLSPGDNEKNAISEAETRAERHNKNAAMQSATTELIEIAENCILENKSVNDSASKMKQFIYLKNHEPVAEV